MNPYPIWRWISFTLAIGFMTSCGGAKQSERDVGMGGGGEGAKGSSPIVGAADTSSSRSSTHGLQLPATFRGELPCAGCQAIRYHLDLWPDNTYHLRREWVGKNQVQDKIGRWIVGPARRTLILYEVDGEVPLKFEVSAADRLRLLDVHEAPIESSPPSELISDGNFAQTVLSLSLGGEMVYMADAARFTECLTGRSYPIAMEGDFVKLQQAYLKEVKKPGEPLYVTFEGSITDRPRMEGSGVERSVVVQRFIHIWPNQKCEQSRANASLTNTYWRIDNIEGQRVYGEVGRREPHLVLRSENRDRSYAATVGCNEMGGTYTLEGENILFAPPMSTMVKCPQPLDTLEKALRDALSRTKHWQVTGNTLEFRDDQGLPVALFEAVYL